MPNLNYRRGADFERSIIKNLEARNFDCFRSAGSHRCADVIALKGGEVLLIQAQINKDFPPAKREALIDCARRNNCQAWLYWRENRKFFSKQIY